MILMSPLKSRSGFFAIALLLFAVVACKQLQKLGKPTVLTSPDGKFQLTLPSGWEERPALHAGASIKAANVLQEAYVIVMTDSKIDLADDMTLDKFTDITRRKMLTKVTEGDSTPPVPVTINGNPGLQYALTGVVDIMKISYLITTVETTEHYHQIITWTLRSRADQNHSILQKVTESFRSTDAASAHPQTSKP
jgi:hypothetical protein